MIMLKGKTSGFTVIELLISLAVFAVVVPTIASGVTNLIVLNNRARNLTVANLVAESKMEELRSSGFNALPLGTTDMPDELPSSFEEPEASYKITNVSPGIAEVVLTITYDDYGQTKTLQYKTIVSELGVGQ